MQNTFLCSKCGQPFTSQWPASVRYRIKNGNKVYCSKACASLEHGMYNNSEYGSWQAMKNRCNNPSFKNYDRYGGRGITYDPVWNDFVAFFKDMGEKPSPKHELERIDNDKNYCKENCKWATKKEQTRNRGGARATRLYTYEGKTMCIKDWADYVGISASSMQKRLNNGWPLEKAFSPVRHDKPDLFEYDGKTMSLKQWSDHLGISKNTLYSRLSAKYPPEIVFSPQKFDKWALANRLK